MRVLFILVIIAICFIQVNESLFNKISHANIAFASSADSLEGNIPIIDRNVPSNIEAATFAMG